MSGIVPFTSEAGALALVAADERLARLPDKVRGRIQSRLGVIGAIRLAVGNGSAAGVQEACQAASFRMGGKPSWRRLYNDYFAVERARAAGRESWTALYHGDADTDRAHIAKETAEFIWGWMQKNQRSSKQGFRDFVVKHWRAGLAVPGIPKAGALGTWREWHVWRWPERPVPVECPPDLPRGWSYENLMRPHHKPAAAELAAVRIGVAAALTQLPPIPGSRRDMRPLEWVTFDDVRFDFRIHVEGVGRPVDLVGLVAMDIATGAVLGFGLRPVLLREDGSGEKLKAQDTKELIVSLLCQWGWPSYGMTIIQENGTATTSEAFQAAVKEATGGHVKFQDASMLGGTVWAGGFADRAGGNSRAKAWIESLFNPMHNILADLPGQSGRRYDAGPSSDHGRRKELAQLTKAGARLAVEDRRALRMPYLDLDEARGEIAEAFSALNARDDHAMADFAEVLEWRWAEGEQWRVWAVNPPPEGREGDVLSRKRVETPAERFERMARAIRVAKLAGHSVPALLGNQRTVKLERGQIVFECEGRRCVYSPYTAENIPTLQRISSRYGEGKALVAYYAASDLNTIYLTDGDGRWVGELWRTVGEGRGGNKELNAQRIATKKQLLNQALANVNRRSPEVAAEREEDVAHNLDVLANAALVPVIGAVDSPRSHEDTKEGNYEGREGREGVHSQLAGAVAKRAGALATAARQEKTDAELQALASKALQNAQRPTSNVQRPMEEATAAEDEDHGL